MTGDTLLDVLERAVLLAKTEPLAAFDAETLLSLAEEATVVPFAAGESIGADGAAYVLPGRAVPAGEVARAESAVEALRIEADRWLELLADEG